MRKYALWIILAGIVLLGAYFRFSQLAEIPPGLYNDEAVNGVNALQALGSGDFKAFYADNNGREGLFINIQALSVAIFGRYPWALRGVSAVMGTLAILAVFFAARELFWKSGRRDAIALVAAFLLASSYWHIHLSRIGFRAIMTPLMAALAIWLILRALRTKSKWTAAFAGISIGLGLQTYIAFRFVPFVVAIPLLFGFVAWWREKKTKSFLALAAIAIVPAIISVLPLVAYFIEHPQDFFGRSNGVSIFSAPAPLTAFAVTNAQTLGMLFLQGDCNPRHNYACRPELHWLTMILFAIGAALAIAGLRKKENRPTSALLLAWLFFMSLPATLTMEGMPHSLRSIGMTAPIMILAAWGGITVIETARAYLLRLSKKPENKIYENQLQRIAKEAAALGIMILFIVPAASWRDYFIRFGDAAPTFEAFNTDVWKAGEYLESLSHETAITVVTNVPGASPTFIPKPDIIRFATETETPEKELERRLRYVPRVEDVVLDQARKNVVLLQNALDQDAIHEMNQRFPDLKPRVGDVGYLTFETP